ncbi:MAG: putative manganese-dependent inorganic diphosphatase [Oscillospiraceae bacterium]|nr:putative manganese-dependent inorganic diphosphatase [Oscillospiraceae bacterium]
MPYTSDCSKEQVFVIGHQNPDTDSICAAIGYAAYKRLMDPSTAYIPARAGALSAETAWVLQHFGLPEPRLLEDVSPTVRDLEIRLEPGISHELTVKRSWETMRDREISTLPIVGKDGRLEGIVTLRDLAIAQMDSTDNRVLSASRTPYCNMAKVLNGTVICGDAHAHMTHGRALVGAGNADAIKEAMEPGDLVLVSNRECSQIAALEGGAGCLVVCTAAEIHPEILAKAEEIGCVVISTPYDTFTATSFLHQSVPIRYYMISQKVDYFTLSTPVEEALQVMANLRHVYFPILDDKGKYYGMLSRRNVINRRRKQLILVDHNEKTQCVPGWEQADIREIVDHHRIGGLSTISPIYFRNQPLGSTATIVSCMYRERGLTPSPEIAGALCCAILSDTLVFRSPTCTPVDKERAAWLASIAGEDLQALGEAMFEAGEDLSGVTAEALLTRDYKIFEAGDLRFGVSQSTFLSTRARETAAAMMGDTLEIQRREDELQWVYYLLTDIRSGGSDVLYAGEEGDEVLRRAFGLAPDAPLHLDGVVSRKKQFVPAMLRAIHSYSEEKK